ncbi:MAG: prepilin peptidase [Acidimicrobiales bacterium]
MDLIVTVLAVPVGLVVGGFVTMVVDRVPDATPITLRSRCPHCEHQLGWFDTVPVSSWLRLKGRCRHCDVPITPAYPVVEIATAAIFALVVWRFGAGWELLPPLVLVAALMALSVTDLYVYRLPDRITFPALGLSLGAMVVASVALDRPGAIPRALVGAVGYFAVLLTAHLISPRGMGFGDVKLALLLGLHLGWVAGISYTGWAPVAQLVTYALLMGSVVGVVVGLSVALLRRRVGVRVLPDPEADARAPRRILGQSFPFGPALAAGTMMAVVFSDVLLL